MATKKLFSNKKSGTRKKPSTRHAMQYSKTRYQTFFEKIISYNNWQYRLLLLFVGVFLQLVFSEKNLLVQDIFRLFILMIEKLKQWSVIHE